MNAPRRLPRDFSGSAAYPLFALDPAQDRAWVLHFAPEDYRRASFLDQRALKHRDVSGWQLSRAELEAACEGTPARDRVHWLFHIGHCGSTLASRLLDLLPGVLGLREPLPLLTLAHGRDDPATRSWHDATVALLARGFEDTRAVVVKPTSLVTTLADRLLPGTGHACLLWVDLHTWLATMLRDDQLKERVLATEGPRLAHLDWDTGALPDGPRLARAWLAEQWRWQCLAAEPRFAPRLIDLDFAELLSAPAATSARLAAHYGLPVPTDWERRIADSGLLTRYAKDGAQRFDAETRRGELARAAERHAATIDEGLAWAEAALARLGQPSLAARLRPRASAPA